MRKKYELRDGAFAIWFGVQDIMYSEEDVLAALYGDEQVSVATGVCLAPRMDSFGETGILAYPTLSLPMAGHHGIWMVQRCSGLIIRLPAYLSPTPCLR